MSASCCQVTKPRLTFAMFLTEELLLRSSQLRGREGQLKLYSCLVLETDWALQAGLSTQPLCLCEPPLFS